MIRDYLIQGAVGRGLDLTEEQIQAFELFIAELKKWNRSINLTSLRNDRDIVVKHIIDSLSLVAVVCDNETVMDMGSGAGIPALPLKIMKPAVSVVSVDAVGKKIQFQRHIARTIKLSEFEAVHSRVENLGSEHIGSYHVITSRAFSSLSQFVLIAEKFLAPTGRLIALKGPLAEHELEEGDGVLKDRKLFVSSISEYQLPYGLGERRLIEIKRINPYKQGD